MCFGLEKHIFEKIKEVFTKYPQVNKVILYGSRSNDNYTKGSDIDLTLVGTNIHLNLVNTIENALDELNLPYYFDISIFDQISNKNLLEHIHRVGKVFYLKSKT